MQMLGSGNELLLRSLASRSLTDHPIDISMSHFP